MVFKTRLLVFCLLLFVLLPSPASAIIINEICPVNSDQHPYEWVEVYNDTDQAIDLSSYKITDSKNQELRFVNLLLQPNTFSLATSSSVLNNTGDSVVIRDAQNDEVTTITYGGSYGSNASYARCDGDSGWIQTDKPSPLTVNADGCNSSKPPTGPDSPTQTEYGRIYISEAMVNPQTDQSEWVELYNDNPFTVNLVNWTIDDEPNGGSTPYSFTLSISGESYAVLETDKTMFNNDHDVVRLLNQTGIEKDRISYDASTKDKSIGKTNIFSQTICIQNSTKNLPNSQCTSENLSKLTSSQSIDITNSPTLRNEYITNMDVISKSMVASDEERLTTQSGLFNLGNKIGVVKGATTKIRKSVSPELPENTKELETASAYASSAFMFAWTNICYILVKIRRKYTEHVRSQT